MLLNCGAGEDSWESLGLQGDETTLMAESEEELKSLMMKVKGESQKAGLKLNIQKTRSEERRVGKEC